MENVSRFRAALSTWSLPDGAGIRARPAGDVGRGMARVAPRRKADRGRPECLEPVGDRAPSATRRVAVHARSLLSTTGTPALAVRDSRWAGDVARRACRREVAADVRRVSGGRGKQAVGCSAGDLEDLEEDR